MRHPLKILAVSILMLFTCLSFGQTRKKFVYGGSKGVKHKGTFAVSYFIAHKGRLQPLPDSIQTIDLNLYEQNPKLVVQLEALQLGLNASFSQLKHKDHPKVHYANVWIANKDLPYCYALSTDTLKLGAQEGHYGKPMIQLAFGVQNPDGKKQIQLKVKTETVDGIYNRNWKGITVARPFIIVPRKAVPKTEIAEVEEDAATHARRSNNPNRYRNYRRNSLYEKTATDTLSTEEPTIEDELWAMIEQDQISGKKKSLITNCRLYQMNCQQRVFEQCKYQEEVLFFLIGAVAPIEQKELVAVYKSRYPNGKFLEHLPTQVIQEDMVLVPIEKDLAQIDFDENALLVNRVKGGNKPYFIDFYDYQKNKELAVKSHRFNKEDLSVSLDELGIPQGMYTVKVMDSKGQLFVEKSAVFVRNAIQIPKSIKLSIVLLFIGSMGFLYKKYIHF